MIKIISLFSILIFLTACLPISIYQTMNEARKNKIYSESFEITPAIMNLPFAMQIVEHQGFASLMVLGYEDSQDRLSFFDGDENIFTLFHGKVVSSNNFENNIEIINPPNIKDIFFKLKNGEIMQIKHESFIRFTNPETSYLKLKTDYKILPRPDNLFTRKSDNSKLTYFIMEERFQVPEILWNGKNTYWFSENGNILKSKQMIIPNKPKYFFETLKTYSN